MKNYPFESNYLKINNLNYHYIDEGKKNSETVLMLHGNPTWSFYYRNLIKALRNEHRVIVPDHIGCGLSDKPNEQIYKYTLANRIKDLEILLENLNVLNDKKPITLIVHDWGGMIGMAWATKYPQYIKRLVILNTGAFHLPKAKKLPISLILARIPLLGAILVKGFSAFSKGANKFCVMRKMPTNVEQAYLKPYNSWRNRIAVHRFVTDIPIYKKDQAYAIVEKTERNLFKLKDKPMTIIWGMRDFVFDKYFLAEWTKRFPQADLHKFENAGHYILEDETEIVIKIIKKFVN
jgi:haloalkane dehalogenase